MNTISYTDIQNTRVLIRSGGDLASGVAHRLFRSGFKVCLIEAHTPLAVRRMVSFCEAVYDGVKSVEGVTAACIDRVEEVESTWDKCQIPLLIDPDNETRHFLKPHVLIDAILAKRNLGTKIIDAPLVIGMGPGFMAGSDVDLIIETNRGHDLGRLIYQGSAAPNTGIPGTIGGVSVERVLRAPCDGIFKLKKNIGEQVVSGERVGQVADMPIYSRIDGIIRGLLRDNTPVKKGFKAGDVDPRGDRTLCLTISDKARSLGGAVMEAILSELPGKLTDQK